tara:strand:+ start:1281 stop:2306 length:1026 start_codon:yes stop_codon:yes gene_type:complete
MSFVTSPKESNSTSTTVDVSANRYRKIEFQATTNYGRADQIGLRSIDFMKNGVVTVYAADWVVDTNITDAPNGGSGVFVTIAIDTGFPIHSWVGTWDGNLVWISVTFPSYIEFDAIRFSNMHSQGNSTDAGVKDLQVYGHRDIDGVEGGTAGELLATVELTEHTNEDVVENETFTVSSSSTETRVVVDTITDDVTDRQYRVALVNGIPSFMNVNDDTEVIPMAHPNKSNPLANISWELDGWISSNKSLITGSDTLPRGRYKVTMTGQRGTHFSGWVCLNTEGAPSDLFYNITKSVSGTLEPVIHTQMYDHLDEGQLLQARTSVGTLLVFSRWSFEWVCELP